MLARERVYSATWSGTAVMNAGFGATFSNRLKLSIRRISVVGCEGVSWGLYATAISPVTWVLSGTPFSKDMLMASIKEAERPSSFKSGCLIWEFVRLVMDLEDLIDRVSEAHSEAALDDLGVYLIGVSGGDEGVSKSCGFGINMVFRT